MAYCNECKKEKPDYQIFHVGDFGICDSCIDKKIKNGKRRRS